MAEIKSNYNPREESKDISEERKTKFVAVANGKRGKASFANQIYKRFIKEDYTGTRDPRILGVIIPAMKKTIMDVINVFLHPDGKNRYSTSSSPSSKISYRDYYRNDDDLPFKDTKTSVASVLDYDSIVFDTRGEAEKVLSMMDEVISTYNAISIADYYEICGIDDANYTACKYGWRDIRTARVVRTTYNQYQIKLPKAIPLSSN